jgi:hypothetical protein
MSIVASAHRDRSWDAASSNSWSADIRLVWGALGALGMSAVMPIILLADPRTRSIHALRSLFVDIVPGLFACMAALGGLLALVVAIVGRSGTTEELTTMRFEV